MDLEKRRNSEDLKLAYLPCWPTCFSGKLSRWVIRICLLELVADDRMCEGWRSSEDSLEMWQRGSGGHSRRSAAGDGAAGDGAGLGWIGFR